MQMDAVMLTEERHRLQKTEKELQRKIGEIEDTRNKLEKE